MMLPEQLPDAPVKLGRLGAFFVRAVQVHILILRVEQHIEKARGVFFDHRFLVGVRRHRCGALAGIFDIVCVICDVVVVDAVE